MNVRNILIAFCFAIITTGNAFAFDGCLVKERMNLIVDVKTTGAVGDGVTDDTKAFQKALDQATLAGGTVTVGKGIYLIDAVVGIEIKSNTNLFLAKDSYLRALPNQSGSYSIVRITKANDVAIVGGNFVGERAEHQGSFGEWGMGVSIRGAQNVIIKEVSSESNWGDGFYISNGSKRISFCSVIADNNRRQGMSIISGEDITVINSVFKNTNGTKPEAGIDIEPNQGDSVRGVHILNSKFINNLGAGIKSVTPGNGQSSIEDVVVNGNIVIRNGAGGGVALNSSNINITRNVFIENDGEAIYLDKKTNGGVIMKNVIYKKISGKHGISNDGNNLIIENNFR